MDIAHEQLENAANKYIIFLLGKDLYAAPILSVREVIEYKEPKHLPESDSLIEGVINLRGEVVGVIDLRKRFGIQSGLPLCQLIFESEGGLLAASVDKLNSVSIIDKVELVSQKNIQSLKYSKYLLGIAQFGNQLVSIIDLAKLLSTEYGKVIESQPEKN